MAGNRTDPVITSRSSRAKDLDRGGRQAVRLGRRGRADPRPPTPDLPALRGLGGHEEGEEHLRQPPQVEQLVPAAAQRHVEVGAVLLQSRLLQALRAPRCAQAPATASRRARACTSATPPPTLLPGPRDHLHVLQRRLQHFICTHSRNVHLGSRASTISAPLATPPIIGCCLQPRHQSFRHLLSSTDQDRREEAKGHPQLVDARIVVGDVPESRGAELHYRCVCVCVCVGGDTEGPSYLYQGYTKFSRTNSNTCRGIRESLVSDSRRPGVAV